MAVAPAAKKGQQIAGFAVLGAALLLAAGVAAFFLFTGGDDGQDDPVDVVRALYAAVEAGDAPAFEALLSPDAREQELGGLIPFPQTLGEYSPIDRAAPPDVTIEDVHEIGREGEWALVGVRGKLLYERAQFDLAETVYLRQVARKWLVSTEFEFSGGSGNPSPGAGGNDGLGVLQPQRPKVGEEAPDFALASASDGSVVRLSDFRGKAVVVNFYASWCEPCKEEIPEFQDAQEALGDQVVFLGVNFGEDQKRALGILELFQATYPAVLDTNKEVAQHYRATGLPHTVFVDAEGIVRGIRIGLVTPAALEDNLAKVGITYSVK